MQRPGLGRFVTALLLLCPLAAAAQSAPLRLTSAAPHGTLESLDDSGQIRIMFSEPMTAIGTGDAGAPPPWVHLTPATITIKP